MISQELINDATEQWLVLHRGSTPKASRARHQRRREGREWRGGIPPQLTRGFGGAS